MKLFFLGMVVALVLISGFEMTFHPLIEKDNEDYVNNWIFFNVSRYSFDAGEDTVFAFIDYGDRIERRALFPLSQPEKTFKSVDEITGFSKDEFLPSIDGFCFNFPGARQVVIIEMNKNGFWESLKKINLDGKETIFNPIKVELGAG